jgi:geranylgeranyl diphosphate synthase, type II
MEMAHAMGLGREDDATRRMGGRARFSEYLGWLKPRIDENIMHHLQEGPAGASIDRRMELPLKMGKRLRGGLLMLIFETFGQEEQREKALDLASAVEIAHAASLIVDDMLDEDTVRHGMPSVHMTSGHKGAMLGTIAILSYPYQIASIYGAECVLRLAETHRAMVKAATRELNAVPSFGMGPTYENIIENKTGTLFSLAGYYGAIAAGCPTDVVRKCSDFGMLTGKAMQIADDISDLESLFNGKKASIGGSEAMLLRCCLGQKGMRSADEMEGPVSSIGSDRRKDVQDTMNRHLQEAVRNAVGAAPGTIGARTCEEESAIPLLTQLPAEIASMVLNERK